MRQVGALGANSCSRPAPSAASMALRGFSFTMCMVGRSRIYTSFLNNWPTFRPINWNKQMWRIIYGNCFIDNTRISIIFCNADISQDREPPESEDLWWQIIYKRRRDGMQYDHIKTKWTAMLRLRQKVSSHNTLLTLRLKTTIFGS